MSDKKYKVLIYTATQKITTETSDEIDASKLSGFLIINGNNEIIYINMHNVELITVTNNLCHRGKE